MTSLIDTKDTSIFIKVLVVIAGILLSSLSGWFLYDEEEKAALEHHRCQLEEEAELLKRGKERIPMPQQDPIERAKNFDEVALGYTLEMARKEAA